MTTLVAEERIREESLWFGAEGRQLFGRLITPVDGMARGAVLLSPPIGRESRLARRALRTLAMDLAAHGYVALRFDHYGTGDSSGSLEDDEIDRTWLVGVQEAVAFVRSWVSQPISAVGMRMGATILGAAASEYDLDLESLALWDPCESGRAYARELAALGALQREVLADGFYESTTMLEYPLSAEVAQRLSKLSLRDITDRTLASRVLIVTRDDRPVSEKFREKWASAYVEWATTSEQGTLLETQLPASVQPWSTISEIRTWLTAQTSRPVPLSEFTRPSDALVVESINSSAVRESVLELGTRRMFGVLCEPTSTAKGPLMIMVNGMNEDHVGPARLWVDLSRRWASLGLRCVRFDLSQLGESPWSPDQGNRALFDKTWARDVREAVRALAPSTSDCVLIGYCHGARLALEVAAELDARGACAINPGRSASVHENVDRVKNSRRAYVEALVGPIEGLLEKLPWLEDAVRSATRFVLSLAFPPKVDPRLISNQSDVLLLLSREDLPRFQWVPILRRRLVSSGRVHVEIVPGMDHAILSTMGRYRAVNLVNQYVEGNFVLTSAPAETGRSATDEHRV